ncbi:hypothetical protein LWI29_013410 [Acer saccharum]|uniref:Uncharacterized protein n=1 Tax=Acer saccharum TaxID=4024 RepID=A0AA39RVD7_ACESA|nr:hypothetical protein LWI29_013410 [Acer saccharum]
MADVDLEVATAAQLTKRTFKKFSFKGVDLDALLDSLLMSLSSSSLHVLTLASDLPLSCQIKHLNLASCKISLGKMAMIDEPLYPIAVLIDELKNFELVIVASQSCLAVVSLLYFSYNFRKYGNRRFLLWIAIVDNWPGFETNIFSK